MKNFMRDRLPQKEKSSAFLQDQYTRWREHLLKEYMKQLSWWDRIKTWLTIKPIY